MADIFISYSKAHRPLTEALVADLEARGYTVWWDTSLVSGETFREVILRELNAARAAIVIWSPASVQSDWVISEATRAKAQGKLITVRSAKVAPADIPPPFDVLHCDLIDNRERIYAALAKFGVLPFAGSGAPKAEARPASPRPKPWLWLGAAVVSLAAVAAVYFGTQKPPACTAADWEHVQKTERIGTLRGFASDCKGTRYGDLAEEEIARRDKAAWDAAKAANSVDAYQAYLRDWPHGAFATHATGGIAAIKKAEEDTRKAEDAAWAKAEEVDLIAGWQAYLQGWPEGRHAAQANASIAARKKDRLIRSFTGHTGWVLSVAISPDGRTALSGSDDKTLKLWDLATGRELRTFTGHSGRVKSVAISPDGRTALSGSEDKTLKLWDLATGRELRTFAGHAHSVSSVAISPDGRTALSGSEDETLYGSEDKTLYGSRDKTLKLWDLATGKELRSFTGHPGSFYSVAISPDGRTALSGSEDNTLKLWDLATGRKLRSFTGHTVSVSSVAISPDGRTALSGSGGWSGDNTLKLWDLATGKELRTFTGHTHSVSSVAISPDGRTALSGSWDRTLKLWDVATGRELRSFTGHTGWVRSVAISPDGRTALSGAGRIYGGVDNTVDNTLKHWDLTGIEEPR